MRQLYRPLALIKPKSSASSDLTQEICDAALRLSADKAWNDLTLEQIAKAAKLPLPRVRESFPNKNAILPAIVRQNDEAVARILGKPSAGGTPHDRLFDVMMTRFEVLQKNRQGFLNIMASGCREPNVARVLLPAQYDTMKHMLTYAGLAHDGAEQVLAVTGLGAVYAVALCRWMKDDTADLSRTMAALDKQLRWAGKIAEFLFSRIGVSF